MYMILTYLLVTEIIKQVLSSILMLLPIIHTELLHTGDFTRMSIFAVAVFRRSCQTPAITGD